MDTPMDDNEVDIILQSDSESDDGVEATKPPTPPPSPDPPPAPEGPKVKVVKPKKK